MRPIMGSALLVAFLALFLTLKWIRVELLDPKYYSRSDDPPGRIFLLWEESLFERRGQLVNLYWMCWLLG